MNFTEITTKIFNYDVTNESVRAEISNNPTFASPTTERTQEDAH